MAVEFTDGIQVCLFKTEDFFAKILEFVNGTGFISAEVHLGVVEWLVCEGFFLTDGSWVAGVEAVADLGLDFGEGSLHGFIKDFFEFN